MNVIVSSKTLAEGLSKIDFDGGEHVTDVDVEVDTIKIFTNDLQRIDIGCASPASDSIYAQLGRRWDWLYDTVLKIDEQPISLIIEDETLEIKIQY